LESVQPGVMGLPDRHRLSAASVPRRTGNERRRSDRASANANNRPLGPVAVPGPTHAIGPASSAPDCRRGARAAAHGERRPCAKILRRRYALGRRPLRTSSAVRSFSDRRLRIAGLRDVAFSAKKKPISRGGIVRADRSWWESTTRPSTSRRTPRARCTSSRSSAVPRETGLALTWSAEAAAFESYRSPRKPRDRRRGTPAPSPGG
jgi:hypothetical protein